MRKYISILIAILLIAVSFIIFKKLANSKKTKKHDIKSIVKSVQTQKVQNTTIPVFIKTSGIVKAKDRIDLFTEVQGIISRGAHNFKPGTFYKKGETLLRINSDEFSANLRSLKSNFYSVLTAMIPDLRLDFPEVYPKWQDYLSQIDLQKTLPELPEINSEKERYFITGRKVLSSYYSVKNAEARLAKYRISAPFSGVLSETFVNPGSLVRPGQKLGSFVNTKAYELVVSISTKYMDLLQKGKKVNLENAEHTKHWTGTVVRLNPIIDANSQSMTAYIYSDEKGLKEGLYLEARLPVKTIDNAFEIPRKLLVNDNEIYIVKDSVLKLQTVEPVFYKEKTAIIKGLKNNTDILIQPVPGAHEGMPVKTR